MLIGDTTFDLKMSDGVQNPETMLTIGFLNCKKGEDDGKLNEYLEKFDIVLQDDQTMEIPNLILRTISRM